MFAFAAVIVLGALGVWLFCLFDVLSTDDARRLPKFVWFLIVLLGFDLGAVAWLLFGRRRGVVRAGVAAWPPEFLTSSDGERRSGRSSGPAPLGPDDDPEFLRRLDDRLRGEDDDA
jgi:hypothetical protein